MEPKNKVLAKSVQFFKGVELMGSKASAQTTKNTTIEVTPLGPKVSSKSSKRTVLVPWANVTGIELYWEEPEATTEPEIQSQPKPRGRPPKELT